MASLAAGGATSPRHRPRIHVDDDATSRASTDFGGVVNGHPAAVLYPSSEQDIVRLLRFAYDSPRRFTVTARGRGHSDRGQSVGSTDGVTVDMRSLQARTSCRKRLSVSLSSCMAPYVDAGGEQLWSEVMLETLPLGLSPRTWLDYLDLTVGGTLSVGGISGQAFRHGPQVSNVLELDVITGKGEMITCSEHLNPDLFYAALGGLGQFGIITRARIALQPAPSRVRWVCLVYTDFELFTRDEEYLMSMNGSPGTKIGFSFIEGFFVPDNTLLDKWRTPFIADEGVERICSLAAMHGRVYFLEATLDYNDTTASSVDQDVDSITQALSFTPGFKFTKDIFYTEFIDRLRSDEHKLRMEGLWDVPHPWLNMLVPKSRIHDFNQGVFKGILQKCKTMGVILCYPISTQRWDRRMSLMFPEGEISYKIGLLWSCTSEDLESVLKKNEELLLFCDEHEIEMKQYMPHYETKDSWMKHFGSKWGEIVEMKRKYDPKAILAPRQKIFMSPLVDSSE